ncbi:hypothetical protein L1887_42375 [Cichorium endivia]|nr:hypothetical protein L1887_42375 [Cichorium endivia]
MCARRGPNPRVQGAERRLCAAAIQFSQFRVSKGHVDSASTQAGARQKRWGIFFGFGFSFSAKLRLFCSRKSAEGRQQTDALFGWASPCSISARTIRSFRFRGPTQSRLRRRGQRAKQQARQPAGGSASRWQSCSSTALLCTALQVATALCSCSRLSPTRISFSTAAPSPFLSLAHTHTNAHTQTPCTDASACLPANLPAPARPLLPRSETALQRAGPVLCLCLCRCLGRPSAAPPVFGRSPSCIAIAENILTTSTRRRLKPAQAKPRQALHPLPTVYIRSLRSSSSLVTPSFCLLLSCPQFRKHLDPSALPTRLDCCAPIYHSGDIGSDDAPACSPSGLGTRSGTTKPLRAIPPPPQFASAKLGSGLDRPWAPPKRTAIRRSLTLGLSPDVRAV